MLDNVVRECMHVSKQYGGIPSPSTKHYYASVLFTVLCTRASSVLILTPNSPWTQKIIENWDYASIANLTRSIVEVRATFFIFASMNAIKVNGCVGGIFSIYMIVVVVKGPLKNRILDIEI